MTHALFARHPVAAYFGMAYAASWSIGVPGFVAAATSMLVVVWAVVVVASGELAERGHSAEAPHHVREIFRGRHARRIDAR